MTHRETVLAEFERRERDLELLADFRVGRTKRRVDQTADELMRDLREWDAKLYDLLREWERRTERLR